MLYSMSSPGDTMKIYFPFAKIDAEQREVWGYASTEARDDQGEIIKRDAPIAALGDYMKFANIREMHQLPLSASPRRPQSTTEVSMLAPRLLTIRHGRRSSRASTKAIRSGAGLRIVIRLISRQ